MENAELLRCSLTFNLHMQPAHGHSVTAFHECFWHSRFFQVILHFIWPGSIEEQG